jgi:catechol 2,3-dioxygenase-like lactoylglutathione lyase family enzyme
MPPIMLRRPAAAYGPPYEIRRRPLDNRPTMRIDRLDHLVLTVKDLEATIAFYAGHLGMEPQTFGDGRRALAFGRQKINLHRAGAEFEPKAAAPTPGSGDLCFVADGPIEAIAAELGELVELGPVERTGALGTMDSVYLRDPDANLIEISVYR